MPGKFSAGREKTKNSHHHQSKVAKDHHRNLTGTNKSVESSATFSHLESLNNDLVSDQGGDYLDSIVHRSAHVVDNENDGPTTSCSARSSIIRQSDGNEDDDASSTGVLTHHSHTSNSTTFNPNTALSATTYAFKKKPFYILLPHSELRSSWDLYMSILLVYVAGFVPFRVSYLTSLQSWLKGLEMFIDISFGIDIILNFFTAYEVKGLSGKEEVYECRPKKIAVNYLKGYFVLDFLATFPFDLILKTEAARDYDGLNHASKLSKLPKIIKFLRVARLLRLLRVYRLQQLVRQIENNYNVHQGITRLLNIVSIIMFATHLVGCLWHAIGVNLDIEGTKENCPYVNDQDYDIPLDDVYDGGSWVCREGK